ncbi:hypothetical protein GCM10010195_25220 [Kitasatospora griseola]|nr:hypothetical protein GCM10010195_25220 [Kitasatospora griseola]
MISFLAFDCDRPSPHTPESAQEPAGQALGEAGGLLCVGARAEGGDACVEGPAEGGRIRAVTRSYAAPAEERGTGGGVRP